MNHPALLCCACLLFALAGCRADFVEPPLDVEWDLLQGTAWSVRASSNPAIVQAGDTHVFTREGDFISYVRGRDAFCGRWNQTRRGVRVLADLASRDINFEVLMLTADSLRVRLTNAAGAADLLYTPGEAVGAQFSREASNQPSGYTITSRAGAIGVADENDWRTTPDATCKIAFSPVFPNPAEQSDSLSLRMTVFETVNYRDGLVLAALGPSSGFQQLDGEATVSRPGTYTFRFSAAQIRAVGLRRLYVFDREGNVVSYGDVQIRSL